MTAYYNEFDKFAAEWLRQLIKAGHIAPGIVDERSIEDVTPGDLAGFTQCHWFAGVAVWSYALRRAGWPDSRRVWTASCPCQPFSAAGQGVGFADERHLWPAFYHLVSQCRPDAIYGEQVASKDAGPWIDLVHTDLEALGYAFGAVPFPSASVGAPHIRDRLYWGAFSAGVTLGDTGSKGLQRLGGHGDNGDKPGWLDTLTAGPVTAAGNLGKLGHAQSRGFGERGNAPLPGSGGHADGASDAVGGLAHTGRVESEQGRRIAAARHIAESGRDGEERGPGPVNGFWRAADWLHCRDGKWRPVEPGTFPLANGAAARVGRLRGYGNAINAIQAQIFIEATLTGPSI